MNTSLQDELSTHLRVVPDFPRPGIRFQDVSPLLQDGEAFRRTVDGLAEWAGKLHPTVVAGIESRGFLFGAPLAERLGVGFVPIRKSGKLPWKTYRESYRLEYGEGELEVHQDAAGPGDRVVLVDDLLATGGTAAASLVLLRRLGADVVGCGFVVELDGLDGRSRLHGVEVHALVRVPA